MEEEENRGGIRRWKGMGTEHIRAHSDCKIVLKYKSTPNLSHPWPETKETNNYIFQLTFS